MNSPERAVAGAVWFIVSVMSPPDDARLVAGRVFATRHSLRIGRPAFADLPQRSDDPLLCLAPDLNRAPQRTLIALGRGEAFKAALVATGIVSPMSREIGASLEALCGLRSLLGAGPADFCARGGGGGFGPGLCPVCPPG